MKSFMQLILLNICDELKKLNVVVMLVNVNKWKISVSRDANKALYTHVYLRSWLCTGFGFCCSYCNLLYVH